MSRELLDFVEEFLRGNTPAAMFVDIYMDRWRVERDSNRLLADDPLTSEKLSSFFCLADLYNPDDDRKDYEYDEARLRCEMQKVFDRTT